MITNEPDDFSRKIKALEEDKEFVDLFTDLKAYRWSQVEDALNDTELMMKVSRRMGGVPRDAKMKADKLRKTPLTLQEACKFGDLKALQRYLSETEASPENREIDAKDHKGITCLGYAVGANRMNIAKVLIEAKADPSVVDNEGSTARHYAAGYGRVAVVEYLQ